MISVIIVEDQSLVRDAIATLLSLEDDISVLATFENGAVALEWLSDNQAPNIVLTDIEMPEMSGLELCEAIQAQGISTKTIIMTTFSKPGYIKRALSLGVLGFILKESDSQYLIQSLKSVIENKRVIAPELAIMALDDNNPLSEKESKALSLAADGLKTQDIASALFLSEGTVRNYLSEAISKLDATNRVDAARIARQKGWI